jgi:hypothetical protein
MSDEDSPRGGAAAWLVVALVLVAVVVWLWTT